MAGEGRSGGEWVLGRRVATSCGEVAWEVFGEGPAVVLVHGTPSNSYLWRKIVPVLAERHSVYVYDLPGFGGSERAEGREVSIAAQARVLRELVGAWGLGESMVAGHDIGGGVVLRAHLLEGVRFRRMALLDAVALSPWGTPTLRHVKSHIEAYRTMPSGPFEAIVASHLRTATVRSLEEDAFEAYLSQWRGEEGKAAYLRKDAQLDERDTAEMVPLLGSVEVPVRILWGGEDGWIDPAQAEVLAERIPNSEATIIGGAGHFVMEDAPEEVARILADFFSEDGSEGVTRRIP
ncbi:MAG: alpha/beta fold hydrolase [Rubrobacteraceae bacterium]